MAANSSAPSRPAQRRRDGLHERSVLEVRSVDGAGPPQAAEPERRAHRVDVRVAQLEILAEDAAYARRHLLVDGDADDGAEAAAAHELLDRLEQVVGFQFLDGELGVAGHAEGVRLEHLEAGEQRGEVGGDDLLQPGEPLVLRAVFAGRHARRRRHRHEPRQRVGDLDAREVVVAAGVAREDAEVVAHVGDVREGATGVERQRRQHREDLLLVVVLEGGALPGVEALEVDDVDPGRVELGPEVAEARARRLHDAPGALLRDGQQLLRRVAVRGGLADAGLDLLPEAGDAHHEELAEDRPDDADELDALEEGVVRVASLVEHALEEVEHAELTIDVERRIAEILVHLLGGRGGVRRELFLRRLGALLHGLPAVILVGARALLGAPHCLPPQLP